MRFGGPRGLLEQVVFELDFPGMGRISKSEVRKGSKQELEWFWFQMALAVANVWDMFWNKIENRYQALKQIY